MPEINPVFPSSLDNRIVYLTCRTEDIGGAAWKNLDIWGHCPPHEAAHLRLSNGGQGDRYVGWWAPLSHVVLQRACFRPIGELAGRIYYLLDTRLSDFEYMVFSSDFADRFVTILNEEEGEAVMFSSLEIVEMEESEMLLSRETGYVFSREILDREDIFDRNKCNGNGWTFESSAYFDDDFYGWCLGQ